MVANDLLPPHGLVEYDACSCWIDRFVERQRLHEAPRYLGPAMPRKKTAPGGSM
jgi:hypothetical protein